MTAAEKQEYPPAPVCLPSERASFRFRTFEEFWAFYKSQHRRSGTRVLHFVGITLGLLCLILAITSGRWILAPFGLFLAATLSLSGHLFVERNRPTSGRHPLWAARAALRMYWGSWRRRFATEALARRIAALRYEIRWRYLQNPQSRRRLRSQPPVLSPAQKEVIQNLKERGVATASFQELGISPEVWDRLQGIVKEFVESPRVDEATRRFPEEVKEPKRNDAYMVTLFEAEPTLSLSDPFLRAALDPPVLDIVNSYLELWAKLVYVDVWYTIPHAAPERIGSQRWHRDPEDKRMLKVYLYFSDVTPESGAMQYVPGSALGGRYQNLWSWRPFASESRYPSEGELEQHIPRSEVVSCIGRPGTLVFCDTSGFHRGGSWKSGSRIAATWTFVTPAATPVTTWRQFTPDWGNDEQKLDAATFALL